jgi:HK97 family phage prohead protease
MPIEYRTVAGTATAASGTLNGLVTPFNSQTTIGDLKRGGFREQIAPGAFKKTLQERGSVFLMNHNSDMPLARTDVPAGNPGHMALVEESREGLKVTAIPVDTSYGDDLLKLVKAGVVRGMSFGFEVVKDSWTDNDGNPSDSQRGINRTIQEVRLHEVSAVTFPAYADTKLSARDAITAARDTRAAKATYSDLETCAECGATNQYGAFCGGCGEPMRSSKPSGDFCTSCGAELDSERDSHVCTETRSVSAEVDAALDAAFKEIAGIDRNALPAEVNQFIDLASAALKLASADLEDEGIPDPDHPNGNDYQENSQEPESEQRDTPDSDDEDAVAAEREADEIRLAIARIQERNALFGWH